MVQVAQIEVGDAKGVFSFAHGVEEGEVKVRDGAVALVSIPGIAQVAVAEFETASEVPYEDERPFVTNRVVLPTFPNEPSFWRRWLTR